MSSDKKLQHMETPALWDKIGAHRADINDVILALEARGIKDAELRATFRRFTEAWFYASGRPVEMYDPDRR